ncbi:DUF3168 domain-containing protein [Salinicola aestuarinus]|uniref:DUF3168 domain-containing protein n=1 Tax=Salinicola aestuarinus TaxID=1949082 RepID=UPI000DA2386A|nr:DUF3168 domain-containing protein [Salinicola aestuarinus]
MDLAPLFAVCAANPGVTAVLGSEPTRIYPFDQAPANVATPYATYQLITGIPENYLADRPDVDSVTLQVDVYAETGSSVRAAVVAMRDAIETRARIARWGEEDRDPDTGLRHRSFDVDWIVRR